jgi:5'-nucleotidase
MAILVTNDDGIFAPGLRVLAKELKSVARVVVVAPDREQSATGTSVTLRQPLRVQRVTPIVPDVDTYSVEGTPSDSVILALGKLTKNRVDMVISGINQGPNLGDDVLLSGTVGAALQGYLRGLPALAISIANADSHYLDNAAKLAALLARKILAGTLPVDMFLNINLPDLPLAEIKGIKITQPAHKTHIDTVEEGHDGRREYYWLVRQKLGTNTDKDTDIWTLEQGNISITALHNTLFQKPPLGITDSLCSDLFQKLKQS